MYTESQQTVGLLIIFAVIAATANAQVTEQFFRSFTNLAFCKDSRSSSDYSTPRAAFTTAFRGGYCRGIVEGALRALYFSDTTCIPPGVTQGQAMLVVVKYMEQHPELLHQDLAALAADALHIACACHGSGDTLTR
jgi:Rap1a immunity proteins